MIAFEGGKKSIQKGSPKTTRADEGSLLGGKSFADQWGFENTSLKGCTSRRAAIYSETAARGRCMGICVFAGGKEIPWEGEYLSTWRGQRGAQKFPRGEKKRVKLRGEDSLEEKQHSCSPCEEKEEALRPNFGEGRGMRGGGRGGPGLGNSESEGAVLDPP